MEVTYSEEYIQKLLHHKYLSTAKYKINNVYLFRPDWESDFFLIQKSSGYCYEIEIKISKSDFKNDIKKVDKHSIIKTGLYKERRGKYDLNASGERELTYTYTDKPWKLRPNKFYYCVPDGLIDVKDIPEYAGLQYVSKNRITTIKEAPFIHKEKFQFEEKLCNKFYWYWLTNEKELYRYKELTKELYEELNKLKDKHRVI